jgi:hypothetical protein
MQTVKDTIWEVVYAILPITILVLVLQYILSEK